MEPHAGQAGHEPAESDELGSLPQVASATDVGNPVGHRRSAELLLLLVRERVVRALTSLHRDERLNLARRT